MSVVAGLLVVSEVPFVTAGGGVSRGTLIVPLDLAADVTVPPTRHAIWWAGGAPCDAAGRVLDRVIQAPGRADLGNGLVADHVLCQKPVGREFHDYHELVTAYVNLLSGHAAGIDRTAATPPKRGAAPAENAEDPFQYIDTATARAGTGHLSELLAGHRLAVIGLGGTGSYVLDLLAKTPVRRIHLFDADVFEQHNAFRAPGAASMRDIAARRTKADHLAGVYSRMHRGIVPHRTMLDRTTMHLLDHVDFAFVCIDDGDAKRGIVDALESRSLPFIDVGMGLEITERGIIGTVRTTISTPSMRDHVRSGGRVPFLSGHGPDPYASNVQVADLNALNAALAVIRWKRFCGFYLDQNFEHHSLYGIDANHIFNEDRKAPDQALSRRGGRAPNTAPAT